MAKSAIFMVLLASALLLGCCGSSTPSSYSGGEYYGSSGCSGKTFAQSCQKSCSFMAADPELGIDATGECLSECMGIFRSEGIDPNSCCPPEYQVDKVCEIECSYPDSDYGTTNCMQNCLDSMEQFTGLEAGDCVVPY